MDEADLERLAALIDDVRREDGLALLLVEHDVALVGRLAERVIVLEQGRIVAEGTPATVAADAAVIASFLGTSAAVLAGGRSETRRELIRARR
jgi:branched-chain amino acid transport system ATP-binding protein